MAQGIRRIVTGLGADGKATVISDAAAPNVKQSPNRPGVVINNLWLTDSAPAKINGPEDAGAAIARLEPPAGGTVFRIVEFPPESGYIDSIDADTAHAAFADMGAGHAKDTSEKPPHPFMHGTETVDYALVLEGETYLVMEDTEVLMKAGEVCVQRGTKHAWSNRSDKPCKIAFVLIDGAA